MFVVELLKKEKILGKTGQVASLERDPALWAEEPWPVITLSSIYGNKLQYYIFEYSFFFGMKWGWFDGAAEAFGGHCPPCPFLEPKTSVKPCLYTDKEIYSKILPILSNGI